MFTYATKSEKEETNSVSLSGEIVTEPTFSHEVFGESFFDVKLKVPRLSQTFDLLPLMVSERLTCNFPLFVGQQISLRGQLRSFNKQVDNKSRLLLSVFVRELLPYDPALSPNDVQLDGFLCKQPVFRTTPFNREICDLLLAVNRAYGKKRLYSCDSMGEKRKIRQVFACRSGSKNHRTSSKPRIPEKDFGS